MGGSYGGGLIKLEAAKRALLALVLEKERIDAQDKIGLAIFNGKAEVLLSLCPVGTHKRQIIQAVQSIEVGGGTDINKGLKVAREEFDWSRTDVVRRIVLLTDGHGGSPLQTAEELKGMGVVIEVIGCGPSPKAVDEKLLLKVASVIEGETRYWFIKDQQTLVETLPGLAAKTHVR